MAVKITYFVHGTTIDNENHVSSGRSDAPLSDVWVQQAKDLPQQTDIARFDVVFCSDLQRAFNSAELAFGNNIRIIQDSRLRECNYGTYDGKPTDIVEPLQEANITTRFPEGESYEDVKTRIAAFLDDVKKNYDGKHIAIVWHKAPQLSLDVLLQHKTREEAFASDWRKQHAWQPWWEYVL